MTSTPGEAVILAADLHINSTVAIIPPRIELDDGGHYQPSRAQRWLWECWLDAWDWARDITQGYQRLVVIDGDLADIDVGKRSNQIISRNRSTVQRMAAEVLEPALDGMDAVAIVRGTEAHTGKSGELEELIARDITGVQVIPSSDSVLSWWQMRLVLGSGTRLDVAHHVSAGSKMWSETNAANALAADTIARYAQMEQKPPHLVVRAHVHRKSDSGDNFQTCRALILPARLALLR